MKNNIIGIVFFIVQIIMNPLTTDEWSYIMSFIENNNDKYNLLKACKQMGNCKFYFYGLVYLQGIIRSSWYDNFINVIVNDLVTLPLHIKDLTFGHFFDKPINDYIPSCVTHLTFGTRFNQPINGCIPLGVTHLTFCHFFNQPINDCIPSSVTNLTFLGNYQHPIDFLFMRNIKIIINV